jgi:hypothetical protein
VTTCSKIRRCDAYGITGTVVFLASIFLPETTPQWYLTNTWLFVGALAGAAVFFGVREGRTDCSVGFAFAVLIILLGIYVLFWPPFNYQGAPRTEEERVQADQYGSR